MTRFIAAILTVCLTLPVLANETPDGERTKHCPCRTVSTSDVVAAAEQYTKVVAAEASLVAHWPLQDDLRDVKGGAHGQPKGGQAQFGQGPGAGKALVLQAGRFVTMGDTPQLDLKETTVELWFQPNFAPPARYNSCIIAKRAAGDHGQTRFSIHLWNDYSCLAVWNGRQVMRYDAPDGPLRRGQWYHLAVTCSPRAQRLFLDGVPCKLTDQAGVFNFGQAKLPLSVGSATPTGHELFEGRVANVAVYNKALADEVIAKHVDAMGWQKRRLKLAAIVKQRAAREAKLRAQREVQRAKRLAELMSPERLFAPGKQRVYRGQHLAAIRLPLGGIGAGTIQINGRGEREVWQIFNNYQHVSVPNSFFAVRAKTGGGKPVIRAMQTTAVGRFAPVESLAFRGEYPYAWYDFEDAVLPVRVSMEAFSPLVPMNTKDSAIPCAIFRLSAQNTGQAEVEVSFLATQQNAVGYTGGGAIAGRKSDGYGSNRNRVVKQPGATTLEMTAQTDRSTPGFGDMTLSVIAERATGTASWSTLDTLLDDFAADGELTGPHQIDPTPAEQTADGALAASLSLKPGERRTITFIVTWYFPNARHGGWKGWHAQGNMYTNWWTDARDVARDVRGRLEQLSDQTRLYHDTFYAANLPHWLRDRISSQVAVLRSKTCFWAKNGYFGAWEGCCPNSGCCPGNCTHVWHYAQAHARLFPEIGRRMREQIYSVQHASGALPHRLTPDFGPAADGQLGDIFGAYREHLCSTDRTWLAANWPRVKKAMEHAIRQWDANEDGVLAGAQHNTLDGSLGGSTSWIGTMYLAALEACARMADLQGDSDASRRYRKIRASGAKTQNETLFNGEYYVQIRDPQPRHDYADGCSIDQVLGEWWAGQVGIPPSYPADRVRTALRSLVKYNFRTDFHGIRQVPRKFVHDDDAGTQMIQWPKGNRPQPTILYGDEVMTGFEYSAAATMIQFGMMQEGFMLTRAVHDRYDGRLRTGLDARQTASWGYSGNPFGDDECGKFYARAMSVWSILLACQGFIYDGPAGIIGFRPVWQPDDHVSFFTAAEGWGLFTQRRDDGRQSDSIEVKYGRVKVRELVFELPPDAKPRKVNVRVNGREVSADQKTDGRELRITLAEPITIEAGQALKIEIP